MSLRDLFSPDKRASQKDYLRQLFLIALSDGTLDEEEMGYILALGQKLDLTQEEVLELRENFDPDNIKYRLPQDKEGKFFLLFSLINLILADDEVHPQEIQATQTIVMKLGYAPDTVEIILEAVQYNQQHGVPAETTYQHLKKYLA